MKIVIAVLAMLLGVAAYFTLTAKEDTGEDSQPAPVSVKPLWEQPIPEGTRLVKDGLPKVNVKAVRRNEGNRSWIDFHLTEEHGYMVDGITVRFWYRFKDEESGDIINDTHRVRYFVKQRLESNATLVESTPLLDLEFEHLGKVVTASTSENWGCEFVDYVRAMEPIRD